MTDKTDLLPCPFCGGEKIVDVYIRDGREVKCTSCGGSVHAFQPDASAQARLKWNTRNTKQFVEQACEAVDEVFNNGNYVSVNRFDIKRAIRDKFK